MKIKFVSAGALAFAVLSNAAPALRHLNEQEFPEIAATVTSSAQVTTKPAYVGPIGDWKKILEPEDDQDLYPQANPTEEDLFASKPARTNIPIDASLPTPTSQPSLNARDHKLSRRPKTTKYPWTSTVRTSMTSATFDHTDEEGRTTRSYVRSATLTWAKPYTTTVYSAPDTTGDYTDPYDRFTFYRKRPPVNTRYPPWGTPNDEKKGDPEYKKWDNTMTHVPTTLPTTLPYRSDYTSLSHKHPKKPKGPHLTTRTRNRVYVSAPSRNKPSWRTTTIVEKSTYTKLPSTYSESEISYVRRDAVATPTSNAQEPAVVADDLEFSQNAEASKSSSLLARDLAKSTTPITTDPRTFTKGQVVTTRRDTTWIPETYTYSDSSKDEEVTETVTYVRSYKYTRRITTTIAETYQWPDTTSSSVSSKNPSPKLNQVTPSMPTQTQHIKYAVNHLPEGDQEAHESQPAPTAPVTLANRDRTTTYYWNPSSGGPTYDFTIPAFTTTTVSKWWNPWGPKTTKTIRPPTKTTTHGYFYWKTTETVRPTYSFTTYEPPDTTSYGYWHFTYETKPNTWWWTPPHDNFETDYNVQEMAKTRIAEAKTTHDGSWITTTYPKTTHLWTDDLGLPTKSRTFAPTTMTYDIYGERPTRSYSDWYTPPWEHPTHTNYWYTPVPSKTVAKKVHRLENADSGNDGTLVPVTVPAATYTWTDYVTQTTETVTYLKTVLTPTLGDSFGGAIHRRSSLANMGEQLLIKEIKSTSQPDNNQALTTESRTHGGYTTTLSWWHTNLDTTWTITRQPPPTETANIVKRNMRTTAIVSTHTRARWAHNDLVKSTITTTLHHYIEKPYTWPQPVDDKDERFPAKTYTVTYLPEDTRMTTYTRSNFYYDRPSEYTHTTSDWYGHWVTDRALSASSTATKTYVAPEPQVTSKGLYYTSNLAARTTGSSEPDARIMGSASVTSHGLHEPQSLIEVTKSTESIVTIQTSPPFPSIPGPRHPHFSYPHGSLPSVTVSEEPIESGTVPPFSPIFMTHGIPIPTEGTVEIGEIAPARPTGSNQAHEKHARGGSGESDDGDEYEHAVDEEEDDGECGFGGELRGDIFEDPVDGSDDDEFEDEEDDGILREDR